MLVPEEIAVEPGRTAMLIAWSDGTDQRLSAAALRAASRSAGAVRAAIDGAVRPVAADIRIVEVAAVGNYAVTIGFSDGHDRGIYPWSYLRDLGRQDAAGGCN